MKHKHRKHRINKTEFVKIHQYKRIKVQENNTRYEKREENNIQEGF